MVGTPINAGHGSTCGAKKHQGGDPCSKPAGWGTRHVGIGRCRFHGGNTKNHVANAEIKAVEAKARETLGRLDIEPVGNALEALQDLAGRAVAWMNLMEAHVADLKATRYSGEAGEHIRGEVVLFERAMDRCATVLGAIARAGIDERLARVSERQVEMFDQALTMALVARGMAVEEQRAVKADVARHLRVVAS